MKMFWIIGYGIFCNNRVRMFYNLYFWGWKFPHRRLQDTSHYKHVGRKYSNSVQIQRFKDKYKEIAFFQIRWFCFPHNHPHRFEAPNKTIEPSTICRIQRYPVCNLNNTFECKIRIRICQNINLRCTLWRLHVSVRFVTFTKF